MHVRPPIHYTHLLLTFIRHINDEFYSIIMIALLSLSSRTLCLFTVCRLFSRAMFVVVPLAVVRRFFLWRFSVVLLSCSKSYSFAQSSFRAPSIFFDLLPNCSEVCVWWAKFYPWMHPNASERVRMHRCALCGRHNSIRRLLIPAGRNTPCIRVDQKQSIEMEIARNRKRSTYSHHSRTPLPPEHWSPNKIRK